ncbi:PilW family protein [Acinetobacter indicus]|uniref:PilW family protein n=1 Tax=Acinetobacter indicus TaxID=756892 RepID=UPI00338E27FF
MKQFGYTLIELMIALALGLIIIAAAFQLLIGGQTTLSFQSAINNVQDNANIGINYIANDLHHANLDLVSRDMTNSTVSGLIVSSSNYPNNSSDPDDSDYMIENGLLSQHATGPSFASIGANANGSDILVIQYKPVAVNGFDCEGKRIESKDNIIVQRYFLRLDGASGNLALACDAGYYHATEGTKIEDFNDAGQIILQRVDQFKVLLGVVTGSGQRAYLNLQELNAQPNTTKIVSVQLGIIVRSVDNSGENTILPETYNLFGQEYSVTNPAGITGKFLRVPLEQTIAFRNAL